MISNTSGSGRGGDITLKAGSVSLTDGTQVSATTLGTGQGGNVTVVAADDIKVVGSNLSAATAGKGDAGDLQVTAGRLTVRDQSLIASLSFSDGHAGDLEIETQQLMVTDGAIASSSLNESAEGRGGDLVITASDFVQLSSTSLDGKFVPKNPIPNFLVEPIPSGLFTATRSQGDAGSLTGLRQISSPNKAQSSFVSEEYVSIVVQPLNKTERHRCPKCL